MHRRRFLASVGAAAAVGAAGCNRLGVADSDVGPLAGRTLRVGVLAPRPDGVPDGASLVDGAELAAEHLGAAGVAGADVELVVADTDFDPSRAAGAHGRLCTEAGCDLTVGLYRAASVQETLGSVADHETVHLTTASFDGGVGGRVAAEYDRLGYHFRAGPPSFRQTAAALVEFVADRADDGWNRVAVVTEPLKELDAYHDHLLEGLADHVEVPVADRVAPTTVHGTFDEVEAAGCDALLAGYWLRGLEFVERWAEAERPFALGGVHVPATYPDAWSRTDGAVEGVFALTVPAPRPDGDAARTFLEDYRERFGRHPMYSGATTYDALRIYGRAVESVVGPDDAELPGQDAIVAALEEVTLRDGVVYPALAFTGPGADRVHEPVWTSMAEAGVPVVQQWQRRDGAGVREAVAPESVRTAAYRAPPWLRRSG